MEMNRLQEKSEASEATLRSKTDLINQQLVQNSELTKKRDSLQLNFDEIQQVRKTQANSKWATHHAHFYQKL